MTQNPTFVCAEATLKETLNIIIESGFRYLPVMKKGVFIGMIDVRDLYTEIQNLMFETLKSERTLFANMMSEPYGVDTYSPAKENFWP